MEVMSYPGSAASCGSLTPTSAAAATATTGVAAGTLG